MNENSDAIIIILVLMAKSNSKHVDVVTCLKGSDDNDEHNHLVISDKGSILKV